jgi:hypothetical protein
MGTMIYVTFGLAPECDPLVAPFAEELCTKPKSMVYTALLPNLGTPATDYIVWSLKQSIDKYGVQGLHLDGTITHRSPCADPWNGFGFYDEQGKLQPRWFIFGARDLAKRMRWLMHVYRKDGLINLGHGSRKAPFICGFVDVNMSGELGMFYGSNWETLWMPEDYPDCDGFRQGIPHQTLTKGDAHMFGPNFYYMYMLLTKGTLRIGDMAVSPTCWYVNTNAPNMWVMNGEYNPYFAKSGVPNVALPVTLWWMLSDDFGCQSADFVPFFHANDYLKMAPETLRAAVYWHNARDALLIVCNFTKDAVQATVKLDLKKLGLKGRTLMARDGFLDDEYPINGDTITLTIPDKNYRLIRVEERR